MTTDKISFPAPERPKKTNPDHLVPIHAEPLRPTTAVEYAKLTLDFSTGSPLFLFESPNGQETNNFENMLSLLNYFGSKGWSVAYKEQNDTIYLQRTLGGNGK